MSVALHVLPQEASQSPGEKQWRLSSFYQQTHGDLESLYRKSMKPRFELSAFVGGSAILPLISPDKMVTNI